STIELGHHLGVRVVAEGIEGEREFELLRKFGCDLGQGYYISRPLEATALQAWLAAAPTSAGTGDNPHAIAVRMGGRR
ncbi:MAG: EAL domain-containing protein, partial [Gammaproteobacteria bacterium]